MVQGREGNRKRRRHIVTLVLATVDYYTRLDSLPVCYGRQTGDESNTRLLRD
jgi:hypothetical protein